MAGRYMRKGTTKMWFVPTIASGTLAPTVAEVTAGVKVTPDLSAVTGFTFSSQPIKVPDMENTFTSEIGGEDATEDSSMDFYERDNSTTIYDALEKDEAGYMVIYREGIAGALPVAAEVADVWPCTVTSRAPTYTVENEAAKFVVKFSMNAPPAFDLATLA